MWGFFLTYVFWLISGLLVLLSVAFFTLFERKIIGLVHFRLGPNKVIFMGLAQPLLDAFKLLTKRYSFPNTSNLYPYIASPMLSLFLSLTLWVVVPYICYENSLSYSFLVFLLITSMIVFPLLLAGWASNSKYSFIGCLRSIAQSISYESVFSTLAVRLIVLLGRYSLSIISYSSSWIILFYIPVWVFCLLAESHRAPFDFSERESELVSGFNTEYSGGLFALVFLAEYSTLLVSSVVFICLFSPGYRLIGLFFIVKLLLFTFLLVCIRVTYCRFRYDLLIMSAWKTYLPVRLFIFLVRVFILN